MDADQKRYFCELYSTGSITKAAGALYISRQGLSKSINNLEKQLGNKLFIRAKTGLEPTESGRILLRYIREDDKLWDTCLTDMRLVSNTEPELVRVGMQNMYFGYDQKRALLAFFHHNPTIMVEVIDGDHDAYWKAIANKTMELAFCMDPPPDLDIPSIKLSQDKLSVLLSIDNPLAHTEHVNFKTDLLGKTILQTSPYKEQLYDAVFRSYGIKSTLLAPDKDLMLARVATGEGFFIIQAQHAKKLTTAQVCAKPLVEAPIEMNSYFIFRPDLSQAAHTVARRLLEPFGAIPQFRAMTSAL